MKYKNNVNFFKEHADTIAIIGVNIAMFAVVLTIALTNISSIASANARIDTTIGLIYELLKERRG
jgi:L-serine deaminase